MESDVSDEQPSNMKGPILEIFEGHSNVTRVSELQPSKHRRPISSSDGGREICNRDEQPLKDLWPISSSDGGK
jgi:hypothetical protein